MDMPRKKKVVSQIPENLLNQVNEWCAHGWILFSYDFDGNLRLHCNFDNEVIMKALRADISNWIDVMKSLEHQVAIQNLMGGNHGE